MSDSRPIEPAEAFALGALHGILQQAKCVIDDSAGIDVQTRSLDVYGLVPAMSEHPMRPCIRITVEEVQ